MTDITLCDEHVELEEAVLKVREQKKGKSFIDIQQEPVKALSKVKLNLVMSRRIRDDRGLTGASIMGGQQTGKTSYALLSMYELFQGDVDKVLDHVVFNPRDLALKIGTAIKKKKRMVSVLWDDASVKGQAAQWQADRKLVMFLSGLGDTMGIATKSLLISSPSGDLIKAFRNYDFYRVRIMFGRGNYDRIAKGYKWGTLPSGDRYFSPAWTDNYDTRVAFYERYAKIRQDISLSAVQSFDEYFGMNEEDTEVGVSKLDPYTGERKIRYPNPAYA